ncbi:MAG: hypothetical protein DMF72_07175 [Acidobacteria bacterium]|nr:MAG: hypothetical protein DMF72_07175 [Acidobacteriota bacterium]
MLPASVIVSRENIVQPDVESTRVSEERRHSCRRFASILLAFIAQRRQDAGEPHAGCVRSDTSFDKASGVSA